VAEARISQKIPLAAAPFRFAQKLFLDELFEDFSDDVRQPRNMAKPKSLAKRIADLDGPLPQGTL